MVQQVAVAIAPLILYPGGVFAGLVGLAAEGLAAWAGAPSRRPVAASVRLTRAGLRSLLSWPASAGGLAGAAGVLALLAATQVAAPFNPLPDPDRSVIVAAAALVGASWVGWARGWARTGSLPSFVLAVQAMWVISLLLPAIEPQNVRPQVLGSVAVPALLPLKLTCAALHLACLPVLLQLVPGTAPWAPRNDRLRSRAAAEDAAFGAARSLLWVPHCGLFVSVLLPPPADDALGLLRFGLLLAGTVAITVGMAAHLARRPAGTPAVLYRRLALPFTAFAVAVALLTVSVD